MRFHWFRSHFIVFFGLFIISPQILFAANESTQSVTLDGVLYKKGTTSPLTDASVQLKVQILNPSGTCLLYEETQTVNTSATKGYFNIHVGSSLAAIKRTVNDPGNLMARVFQNAVAIPSANAPGQTCAGLSYVPSAGDVRYFRLTVTPSSTSVADILTPDIVLDSVPQALVAQSLQGLERAQVLAVNTAGGVSLDQSNLESLFTGTAWTNLQSILNGNFLRTDSSGATLPSYASTPAGVSIGDMWYDSTTNEIKYQTNAGVQTVGATGAVSGNSITSGTISGSTAWNTTGNIATTGSVAGATVSASTISGATVSASTISGATVTAATVSGSLVQGTTLSGSTVQAAILRVFSGAQYVQFTAQAMSASYSLALPTADGVSGQVMATNGLGTLSWITPSSGVAGTISIGQGGTSATSFSGSRMIASNMTGSALVSVGCGLNQVISFDVTGAYQCSSIASIAGNSLIANGGNTTGAAVSIGTNDNQELQLKTNNIVAMTISTNGNVGIGTSNPTYTLDVAGNFASTRISRNLRMTNVGLYGNGDGIIADDGSGSTIFSIKRMGLSGNDIHFQAFDSLVFLTNGSTGTEKMRVTSSGSVGIGISTPTATLDVLGASSSTASAPLALNVLGGDSTFGGGNGGGISIRAGNSNGGANGGDVNLYSGYTLNNVNSARASKLTLVGSQWSGDAGTALLQGGQGENARPGGTVSLVGGRYNAGAYGANIQVRGGSWSTGNGGDVVINGGSPSGGTSGNILLGPDRGYVALGFSNPTSTLDISGALTAQGLSSAPSTSPSRTGRIYFDYATNKFKVSENGGAYQDLVSSGSVSGAISGSGTINKLAKFTSAGSISDSGISDDGSNIAIVSNNNFSVSAANIMSFVSPNYYFNVGSGTAKGIDFMGTGGWSGGRIEVNKVNNSSYDANMMIYTPNNPNQIFLAGYGANSGNVGIGTSTPNYKLEIGPASSTLAINIGNGGIVGPLKFYSPGGISTNFLTSPGSGAIFTDMTMNGSGSGWQQNSGYPEWTTRMDLINDSYSVIRGPAGAGPISYSNLFTIKGSGNIGIGTTNPSSALSISGAVTALGMSSAPGVSASKTGRIYFDYASNKFKVSENGGAYQDLVGTGGSVSGAFVDGGNSVSADAVLGTNSNNPLQLETNGNIAMTISQNGNVGIGTTSPASALQVSGTFSSDFVNVANVISGYQMGGLRLIGKPGTLNLFIGQTTGQNNTVGSRNTFVGDEAGFTNTTGVDNTYVGVDAGWESNGSRNTFLGVYAGNYVHGNDNVVLGWGTSDIEGNFNTFIGTNSTTDFNSYNSSIALGYGAKVTSSNQMVLGSSDANGSILDVYIGQGVTKASPAGVTINATGGSGTDNKGGNLTFAGGRSTGNASPGSIIFSTSNTTGSGSTLQSLSEKMRIDGSGNVGIGTNSPSTALDLSGAFTARGMSSAPSLSSANQGRIYFDYTSNKFKISQNGGAYTDLVPSASGDILNGGNATGAAISIGTNDDQALQFKTNNAAAITISQNGSVGIGTTSPGNSLYVKSSSLSTVGIFDFPCAGCGAWLNVFNSDTTVGVNNRSGIIFSSINSANGYGAVIGYQSGGSVSSGALGFNTNTGGASTEKMRIDENGNVGIGTTSPSGKLEVNGGTAAAAAHGTSIVISGQAGGTGNTNGGIVNLVPGAPSGTGLKGAVVVGSASSVMAGFGQYPGELTVKGSNTSQSVMSLIQSGASQSILQLFATGGGYLGSIDNSGRLTFNTLFGTYAASGNLTIDSTSSATKGNIYINPTGGNVGIGNSSPASALDISGAITARGMSSAPSVSSANQGRIYFDYATNKFKVSENGSAFVDLVGSGGVSGLTAGKIPKAASATTLSDSLISESGSNVNFASSFRIDTATPALINTQNSDFSINGFGSAGYLTFKSTGALDANVASGYSFRIITPLSTNLDLNSGSSTNWRFSTNYGVSGDLNLTQTTGAAGRFVISQPVATNVSSATTALAVSQSGSGFAATFIGGNVGIGTSNPTYQLQLSTDSAAKPGTSTWTIASDERLKDLHGSFHRGLNEILGLNTIYFNYKKDNPLGLPSQKEYVGIKAQDVQKVIPEAVSVDDQGYLHVTNDSIIWTAVNAIKELYQQMLSQNEHINKQGRDIANIEESKADKIQTKEKMKELESENQKLKEKNLLLEKRIEIIEKALLKK